MYSGCFIIIFIRKWGMPKDKGNEYAEHLQHQLRSMCFIVAKAQRRPVAPLWLRQLLGIATDHGGAPTVDVEASDDAAEEAEEDAAEQDEEEAAEEDEEDAAEDHEMPNILMALKRPSAVVKTSLPYTYKWNREIMRAERNNGGLPDIALDSGLPPLDAPGGDLYEARFSGGERHSIPITNDEVRKLLAGVVAARDTLTRYMAMEHVVTHNQVYLSQRLDHHLLLELKEQSRRLLTVTVSMFGFVPVGKNGEAIHVQDTHPALVASMNFMKPIIEKYCKNEIKTDELTTYKKDALKTLKDAQPKKRAEKKVNSEENEPKRRKAAKTECVIAAKTEGVIAAKTEGVIAAKTEGVIAAKTECVIAAKTECVIAAKTEGVIAAKTEGVIAAKTEGVIAAKTECVIAARTEVVIAVKTEIAKPTSMLDAFF
jgi:hypothetical protein